MRKPYLVVIISMCLLLVAASTLVNLSNQVRGVLGLTNGGTGLTTPMVYFPHTIGLLCNGTDEGAAIPTALNTINNGSSTHGAILQLQAGDHCFTTTQFAWPLTVTLSGTGPEGSGQWGTFPAASSSFEVGCAVDQYGCIIMGDIGNANFSNVAFRNTTTCATFFFQSQMVGHFDNVSFSGKQGALNSQIACNNVFKLGLNVSGATCNGANTRNCYFTAYTSTYNRIYTNKIRKLAELNTAAAFTDWVVFGSSNDSNSTDDASLMYGSCNDAGNKCGFSSLVCSTSDVITLGSFNGGGTGAAATVACTGTNAIANGTAITVTANGAGYTSNSTTATGACGGHTCTGTAALTTQVLGPFIDILGYSAGGINASQNTFKVFGELGNAASNVNPVDAHYSSIVRGDYSTQNQATVIGDDATVGYPPLGVFLMTSNARHNDWNCLYYQMSLADCYSDANAGSYVNHYLDPPRATQSIQTFKGAHLGVAGSPFNDARIVNLFSNGGSTTVYECATSGALPAGTLTTDSSQCGTTTDTGLRVP